MPGAKKSGSKRKRSEAAVSKNENQSGCGDPENPENSDDNISDEGPVYFGLSTSHFNVQRQQQLKAEAQDSKHTDKRAKRSGGEVQPEASAAIQCPYLDTVNRKVLDFDFEKLCSVTLSNLNVYACLVCGKFFQGRGINTQAYQHSLDEQHHVFVNLSTDRFYCLPDNYEIIDASLDDVRDNLHPEFTRGEVGRLADSTKQAVHAMDGADYLPGVVGLNNLKLTDWFNSVIQLLLRVQPLRDFFCLEENWNKPTSTTLVRRFGALVVKLHSTKNFKSHVSPHELIQAVNVRSEKKFQIGHLTDPLRFLGWFLNCLHRDLGGTKKAGSSVVYRCFQGELAVTTTPAPAETSTPDASTMMDTFSSASSSSSSSSSSSASDGATVKRMPFLFLSLELPPVPLFKNSDDSIIAQVLLPKLLAKFDGQETVRLEDGTQKTFRIRKLPQFLLMHYVRFKHNGWDKEKNPTLVKFPMGRKLDMKPFTVNADKPSAEASNQAFVAKLKQAPVAALKSLAAKQGIDVSRIVEKQDLVAQIAESKQRAAKTTYSLLANIVHDGEAGQGSYRVHVLHKPQNTWYEMEDLHVWTTETMPELVSVSEPYIQLYERS
jgi:U4/U6.U5 tri-snRNP-associated protein 2